MDYEKEYKKLKAGIKNAYLYAQTDSTKAVLENILPELKESEDEKIRKELIKHLREGAEGYEPAGNTEDYTRWLSWVEKQKEYESTDFEYVWNRTDCGDLTSALDKYSEEAIINMCHAWYDKGIELERKSWLKKQGETFTKKDVDDAYLKGISDTKNELEKQGERKSTDKPKFEIGDEIKTDNEVPLIITKIDEQGYWSGDLFICSFEDSAKWELVGKIIDKVEPKFHEGNWITNGDYTWKIVEVKPLDYILQSQDGNTVDDNISYVDEQFHSFTIQDAKDGDVLCTYECCEPKIVFILKGTPKKHYALSYHCYYNIMYPHFGSDSEKGCLAPKDEDVKPATKEQRDTLFAKMKEAGYEWNAEKKELKKISQRMVSAEAKEALYDKPTDEEMKELLRTEYEKGRADTIAEMEKDWSEEDDVMINKLLAVVKLYYDRSGDDLDKQSCISFLKSLKDKVQSQPKQEWSEDDEKNLQGIIDEIQANKSSAPSYDINVYDRFLSWLKQLKQKIGG